MPGHTAHRNLWQACMTNDCKQSASGWLSTCTTKAVVHTSNSARWPSLKVGRSTVTVAICQCEAALSLILDVHAAMFPPSPYFDNKFKHIAATILISTAAAAAAAAMTTLLTTTITAIKLSDSISCDCNIYVHTAYGVSLILGSVHMVHQYARSQITTAHDDICACRSDRGLETKQTLARALHFAPTYHRSRQAYIPKGLSRCQRLRTCELNFTQATASHVTRTAGTAASRGAPVMSSCPGSRVHSNMICTVCH